jgi:uncharacterized protein
VNVIGFDDGPFDRAHRGDVLLVGVVCSGTRMDGLVSGRVRRDGANAARRMVELVRGSQFRSHLQAVLLQGIAVAGFNVVDVHALARDLDVPVIVIARRPPDLSSVKRALFSDSPPMRPRVPGAARKWALIERAGAIEALGPSRRSRKRSAVDPRPFVYVQRVGIGLEACRRVIESTTLHGNIPEPLRLAHLIAGGITTGKSRGRA